MRRGIVAAANVEECLLTAAQSLWQRSYTPVGHAVRRG